MSRFAELFALYHVSSSLKMGKVPLVWVDNALRQEEFWKLQPKCSREYFEGSDGVFVMDRVHGVISNQVHVGPTVFLLN